MLTRFTVLTILQYMQNQIIMLYTCNEYNVICKLYLSFKKRKLVSVVILNSGIITKCKWNVSLVLSKLFLSVHEAFYLVATIY